MTAMCFPFSESFKRADVKRSLSSFSCAYVFASTFVSFFPFPVSHFTLYLTASASLYASAAFTSSSFIVLRNSFI